MNSNHDSYKRILEDQESFQRIATLLFEGKVTVYPILNLLLHLFLLYFLSSE